MAMIFVGGSRDVFELPEPAIARIGAMIGAEHGVLVGDAPGADAEAQRAMAGEPTGKGASTSRSEHWRRGSKSGRQGKHRLRFHPARSH